ncbi:MAG: hypothetical protein N4A38_03680 [Candidatus Gracilibacteria bacterium]|nr:hypothetical protein [Candidatus Gracilibacteria bacterium]
MREKRFQKFLKENEGTIWLFDLSNLDSFSEDEFDIGHAMLYYVKNGEGHFFSFYPSVSVNEMTGPVDGIFEEGHKQLAEDILLGDSTENVRLVKIERKYVDVDKMDEWIQEQKENPPKYDLWGNNCSDMVGQALEQAGVVYVYGDRFVTHPENILKDTERYIKDVDKVIKILKEKDEKNK